MEPGHDLSAISLLTCSLVELGSLPDGPCHLPWPQDYSTNSVSFGLIALIVQSAKRGVFFSSNFQASCSTEKMFTAYLCKLSQMCLCRGD